MIEQMLTRGTRSRRLWLGLGVFWLAMLVFWIVMLVLDPRPSTGLNLGLAVYWLAFIWYLIGPAQRRLLRRVQRSIRLNEEQLADGDSVSRR